MDSDRPPLDISQRQEFADVCSLSESVLLPLVLTATRQHIPIAQVSNEIRNAVAHLAWARKSSSVEQMAGELRGALGHIVRATLDLIKILAELLPQRAPRRLPEGGHQRILALHLGLIDGSHEDQEQRLRRGLELLAAVGMRELPVYQRSKVTATSDQIGYLLDEVERLTGACSRFSVQVGRLHRHTLLGYVACWRCLVGIALGIEHARIAGDNGVFNNSSDCATIVNERLQAIRETQEFFRRSLLEHIAKPEQGLSDEEAVSIFGSDEQPDFPRCWERLEEIRPDLILQHRTEIGFRIRFRAIEGDPTRLPPRFDGACWFVDLVGSSALTEQSLQAVMEEYYKVYAAAIADQDSGRSLATTNTWGDGLFAAYSDVTAALGAIRIFAAEFASNAVLSANGLRARVGLAIGPLIRQPNPIAHFDVTGPTVVRAARLEASRATADTGESVAIVMPMEDYSSRQIELDTLLSVTPVTLAAAKTFAIDGGVVDKGAHFGALLVKFKE